MFFIPYQTWGSLIGAYAKHVNRSTKALCMLLIAFAVPHVYAQTGGGGLRGIFAGWRAFLAEFIDFIFYGCIAVGLIAIAVGINKMVKKGRQRDEVEWTEILWPLIGGGCLLVLGFIATALVETSGGSASDIGRNTLRR